MAYAVIQIGGPIYGVGESKAEAIKSAMEWLDPDTKETDISMYMPPVNDGDLVCIECSEGVLKRVNEVGGDIPATILLGLLCLPKIIYVCDECGVEISGEICSEHPDATISSVLAN